MSELNEPLDIEELLAEYGVTDLVQAAESQEARNRSDLGDTCEDDYWEYPQG